MEGGLLTKTYFLAGRAMRIGENGALAVAKAPARMAAWAGQQAVSSARRLNPFRLWKRRGRRRPLKMPSPGRVASGTLPRKLPPDASGASSTPGAAKTAQGFADSLSHLRAQVQAMDPANSVAMIKVVADVETTLHKLADTAPSVTRILRTTLEVLLQIARGEVPDTAGAVSEVVRALEVAERRLAAGEDTRARVARPPSVRRHAAPPEVTRAEAAAAEFDGSREKLVFEKALDDMSCPDEATRVRAVRALGGIRHRLSAKAISARLARDSSAEVRKECVSVLTALAAKGALPAVELALSDAFVGVRLAAVRGVYRLAGAEGSASLVRMFSDKHQDVRRRAVACAGWLGQEHLAEELMPMLKDESAYVRLAAVEALANLKSTDAVDGIIALIDDPDESVGRKASDALESITGKRFAGTFPEDEYGRQLLVARWRAWQGETPWLQG